MRRLNTKDPNFQADFTALITGKRETSAEVGAVVAEIIAETRAKGDAALIAYTEKFDRLSLTPETLRISEAEIDAAHDKADKDDIAALRLAADRIRAYHDRQRPADMRYEDEAGVTLGWRWTAMEAAGLYVPGGTASYPSSVLMNAIPAKVAGVERLMMTAPTPDGKVNPLVLVAARLAGVDEIYRVGGAQAVAALAYGTESIQPVDVIVGPGNAYVAAAKALVFGTVGIDMIAGPSEILVVADGENNPDWIAADLLSQAEHDASSQSILLTDDAEFADAVAKAVEAYLETAPRRAIAEASWRDNGAIVLLQSLDEAPALIDAIAPEHLELAVADPDGLAAQVRNAGAIFLGRLTPEALGDYVAGANHVLPTARSARFASGLSVFDFMKRTSLIGVGEAGLKAIGPAASRLAQSEGLPAHAASVDLRLKGLDE